MRTKPYELEELNVIYTAFTPKPLPVCWCVMCGDKMLLGMMIYGFFN